VHELRPSPHPAAYTRGMPRVPLPAPPTGAPADGASLPGPTPLREGALVAAAAVTWLAVFASAADLEQLAAGNMREWLGATALLAFLALFLGCMRLAPGPRSERIEAWVGVAMGVVAVVANLFLLEGMVGVLLVIVAAHLSYLWPPRRVLPVVLLFNLAFAATWLPHLPWNQMLLLMLPLAGFQVFAALTAHYAVSAERSREALAHAHAGLLSTQALLDESARSGERLKLSRELHDVAGHKLTALKLHLARLRRDAALSGREEVEVASALADELLRDIRVVVGQLRADEGIDLRAALAALGTPFPATHVRVEADPALRLDDVPRAEALVRVAQEAVTNAVRHGRAANIDIHLFRDADAVILAVANDGDSPLDIRPGNGLTGMRERVEALGGGLDVSQASPRGLRVTARLPLGDGRGTHA
jgi:signal transduction histidine kinase